MIDENEERKKARQKENQQILSIIKKGEFLFGNLDPQIMNARL